MHVADFYNLFYIGEGSESGKHLEQTADQSAQIGELEVYWKRKVKQNGGFFELNESSLLSFDFVT